MNNLNECLDDLNKWGWPLSFNGAGYSFFDIKEDYVHLMSEWCLPYHIKETKILKFQYRTSKSLIKDKQKKLNWINILWI